MAYFCFSQKNNFAQFTTIYYNFGSENNFWSVLLFVAVLVVYPYQAAAESQYLAEGDKDRVVYLAQGWAEEAR